MILRNCKLDGGDGKHVMKGFNRHGAKSAADFLYSDILGDLENADEGFWGTVGPYREAIEEDRESESVKDKAPVVEVNPAY